MTPQIEWFRVDPEIAEDTERGNGFLGAGFYCRLSASGYLDCTDWSGPFETEDDAIAHLISTYAD